MDDYLGRNKNEKKKESVIGAIKKHQADDKEKLTIKRKRLQRKLRDKYMVGVVLGLHRLLILLCW